MVSFSDGLPNKGSGIPYFYLTALDPTARDALKDDRASFTISEYPIGTCGKIDPENPTCAKITLTGKVCCKIKIFLILIWFMFGHINCSSIDCCCNFQFALILLLLFFFPFLLWVLWFCYMWVDKFYQLHLVIKKSNSNW